MYYMFIEQPIRIKIFITFRPYKDTKAVFVH